MPESAGSLDYVRRRMHIDHFSVSKSYNAAQMKEYTSCAAEASAQRMKFSVKSTINYEIALSETTRARTVKLRYV